MLVANRTFTMASAPTASPSAIIRSNASSRASTSRSVYSCISPPKIFFYPARRSSPTCFARTVLPQTTSNISTISLPGTVSVPVTITSQAPYLKNHNRCSFVISYVLCLTSGHPPPVASTLAPPLYYSYRPPATQKVPLLPPKYAVAACGSHSFYLLRSFAPT